MLPTVRMTPNASNVNGIVSRSSTFIDSYIYMRNTRYNAMYEKNKEILAIENDAIKSRNAKYLYNAFLEQYRILDTVVTRIRNFTFTVKQDVLNNIEEIFPSSDTIDEYKAAVDRATNIPAFKYIQYNIKPIKYKSMQSFAGMFNLELNELLDPLRNRNDILANSAATDYLQDILTNYNNYEDGLLKLEEMKVMTSGKLMSVYNFFIKRFRIKHIINSDFKTFQFYLRQYNTFDSMVDKLNPETLNNGMVKVNGKIISFNDYVVVYKHFSSMMKYILNIVSYYDSQFFNKIYAIQSNISTYKSIMNYVIDYVNALNNDREEPASQAYGIMTESITTDKIIGFAKERFLNIKSLISDTKNKWQGVKDIEVSKKEKESIVKVLTLSKELSDDLLDILDGKDISYETKYEEFLKSCQEFKKHRKDTDKTETLDISNMQNHVNNLEKKLNRSVNIKDKSKKTYRNALWIVINRTIYVVNLSLYNASGKGNAAKSGDFKTGIISKRYGDNNLSFKIDKLEHNKINEDLDKLRKTTSYSEYKSLFDKICKLYNRKDVSAFKLIDLERHDKLVFVGYGKLKPMELKAGTKLYRISAFGDTGQVSPAFKSKDNITFYSEPRIYFTDKYINPKWVLGNVKDPVIHEYVVPKDTVAYRDSEYGSWYHHCLYIETDKPIKVTNVTDQFLKPKKEVQNESIELELFDNIFETLTEAVNDLTEDLDTITEDNVVEAKDKLKKALNYYDKLDNEEKAAKLPALLTVLNKAVNFVLYLTGPGMIKEGMEKRARNKEFMRDLKRTMPMNHAVYNKIYNELVLKETLKIILGIILSIITLAIAVKFTISSKRIQSLLVKIKSVDASKLGSDTKGLLAKVISAFKKLTGMAVITESCWDVRPDLSGLINGTSNAQDLLWDDTSDNMITDPECEDYGFEMSVDMIDDKPVPEYELDKMDYEYTLSEGGKKNV